MGKLTSIFSYYRQIFASRWRYIWAAALIMAGSAVFGLVSYYQYPEIVERMLMALQGVFDLDLGLNFILVMEIFVRNLTAALLALFGGILFGLAPVVTLLVNGFVIGLLLPYFVGAVPGTAGEKVLFLLAALVPHGIIELPMIIIASAFGMSLGWRWLSGGARGQRLQTLKTDLVISLRFVPLLALALFVAALIEVYVSAYLAGLVVGISL